MINVALMVPLKNEGDISSALQAMTALNERLIPPFGVPPLYESGVVYRREDRRKRKGLLSFERWQTAPICLKSGAGDCEDLACWRAAELRLKGYEVLALPIRSSLGYHIIVKWPDGRIEDPSKRLGM